MITVHADPAREGRTLYKWETSFYSRVNDSLKPRNSGSRIGWVHLFLHEVSDTHLSVQNAMKHLELFLNARSLVDKWPQTPHSTRAQQASPPPFSASTTPVIDRWARAWTLHSTVSSLTMSAATRATLPCSQPCYISNFLETTKITQ